ncbi:hypothetical protein JYT86_00850, partial [bacterium AH-315-N03]|nr:hypothetical protein [bacterium AH-315-N03]
RGVGAAVFYLVAHLSGLEVWRAVLAGLSAVAAAGFGGERLAGGVELSRGLPAERSDGVSRAQVEWVDALGWPSDQVRFVEHLWSSLYIDLPRGFRADVGAMLLVADIANAFDGDEAVLLAFWQGVTAYVELQSAPGVAS